MVPNCLQAHVLVLGGGQVGSFAGFLAPKSPLVRSTQRVVCWALREAGRVLHICTKERCAGGGGGYYVRVGVCHD